MIPGPQVSGQAADGADALPRAAGRGGHAAAADGQLPLARAAGAALRRAGAVRLPGVAALQPGRAPGRRAGRAGAPHQRARPRARHHPRRAGRLPPHAPGRLAAPPREPHRGGAGPAGRPHLAALLLRVGGCCIPLTLSDLFVIMIDSFTYDSNFSCTIT